MEQFLYKEECVKTEFTLAKKIHHTKQPAADRCRLPTALQSAAIGNRCS
jgi:hypothetical protein